MSGYSKLDSKENDGETHIEIETAVTGIDAYFYTSTSKENLDFETLFKQDDMYVSIEQYLLITISATICWN